jgi:hypothetical protein
MFVDGFRRMPLEYSQKRRRICLFSTPNIIGTKLIRRSWALPGLYCRLAAAHSIRSSQTGYRSAPTHLIHLLPKMIRTWSSLIHSHIHPHIHWRRHVVAFTGGADLPELAMLLPVVGQIST